MNHEDIQVGVCLVDRSDTTRLDVYCVVWITFINDGVNKRVFLCGYDRRGFQVKKIWAGDIDSNWRFATTEEAQPALKVAKEFLEGKINESGESLAIVNNLIQQKVR